MWLGYRAGGLGLKYQDRNFGPWGTACASQKKSAYGVTGVDRVTYKQNTFGA